MSSGIFVIGGRMTNIGYGLFKEYILPEFAKESIEAHDMQPLTEPEYRSCMLISLSWKGVKDDLETKIGEVLVKSSEELEERERKKRETNPNYTPYRKYDICDSHFEGEPENRKEIFSGVFQTLGLYEDSATASLLFPNIALRELIKRRVQQIDDFKKHTESAIESIAQKFRG